MKKNKTFLLTALSLVISSFCAASLPESGSVSSTTAEYDGSSLVLKGHVLLDHGLGKMSAEAASLEKQQGGKDFPFSVIHLNDEVLLSLKNAAELRCDKADLDFALLKGVLHAKESVSYSDKWREIPFQIKSSLIELDFTKKGHDGKKTDFEIDTITAKENVLIEYDTSFHLQAGHALYKQSYTEKTRNAEITAYPKDPQGFCRLTHDDDLVDATLVTLNLAQAAMVMEHPIGTLASTLLPHAQKGSLRFQADRLIWDHVRNTLLFKGKIHMEESALGVLNTEGELSIVQSKDKSKGPIKALHTKGKTSLDYRDLSTGSAHKLLSFGSLAIDREHLNGIVLSPEVNGEVSTDKQIYYEENEIALYCDKAALEYSIVENTLQPVSIALKGNVRLFSHNDQKPARCALADRVSYSPATRTFILAANPSKKVLFWDQGQSMRIAASEIHITEDPVTKKELVKGVGNVQFSFTSEDNARLKHFFPFYQQP